VSDRYALRRLNPYQGLVQVVEQDAARAVSLDGSQWEIQVLVKAPAEDWGVLDPARIESHYLRFGLWSAEDSLQRFPTRPGLDRDQLDVLANALLGELAEATGYLPFPLRDAFELWLLDTAGRPLALLGSAVDPADMGRVGARRWSAATFPARDLGGERTAGATPVANTLEALVQEAAGSGQVRWFRRERAGFGPGWATDDDAELPAAFFPPFGLHEQWPDPAAQALVDVWLRWMAPALLCLPDLGAECYRRLESLAQSRAGQVDRLWRLYPEQVDAAFIARCRVEARLRRANPPATTG
jgi:hypothetical protein